MASKKSIDWIKFHNLDVYKRFIDKKKMNEIRKIARKIGKVCVWCHGPLTGRRTSWCSDECVYEYMIRANSGWVLRAVLKRDKGVCAICGFDSQKFEDDLYEEIWGDIPHQYKTNGKFSKGTDIDGLVMEMRRRVPVVHKKIDDLKAYGSTVTVSRTSWGDITVEIKFKKSLWEAHHIVPVSRGGGCTGIENFQTCCISCHKKETDGLKKELGKERQLKKKSSKKMKKVLDSRKN